MPKEDSSPVSTALTWAARATRAAVEVAAALSERGVVAVGTALGNLVAESRSQTAELLSMVPKLSGNDEDPETSIREAIQQQTATVERFVTELVVRTDQQAKVAEHAARLTESIATLAHDVDLIASRARMLSLNARIECSRQGESGNAMKVVATELREVSTSVAKANADIAELAGELTRLLPSVALLSAELKQTSSDFSASFEVSQRRTQAIYDELILLMKGTIEQSQARAERITEQALCAVSALSFQDPMVQSLRELAATIELRSNGAAGSDIRLGLRESLELDQAGVVRAGEVALF
jgi:methyl-accepting chemotaxis protein